MRRSQNKEDFTKRYGSVTEGLNSDSKYGVYANIVFLLRQSATIATLVYLRDYSTLQIFSQFLQSILTQIYIYKCQPTLDDDYYSILNEFFVQIYLYIMLILTQFTQISADLQGYLGWSLMGTFGLCVAINVIRTFYQILSQLVKRLQNWRKGRSDRVKKYQQVTKKMTGSFSELKNTSDQLQINEKQKDLIFKRR